MKPNRAFAALTALIMVAFFPQGYAQMAGIVLAIEKHAVLTEQGVAIIRIHIACGPFEGVEEFQQGFAGGSQERTGASSETGIDGMVVCDGVERIHTARLTPFDGVFTHGPANATASLNLCMLVGDEQTCFRGSTSRRVIIVGTAPS
jgi:hypothetical protein